MPTSVVLSCALARNGRDSFLANTLAHTMHAALIVHTSFGYDLKLYK